MSAKFIINMQQELERNMRRVMRLLEWTDERNEYHISVTNVGMEFIHMKLMPDLFAFTQLAASPEYWGWFKNQWHIRDAGFLEDEDILHSLYNVQERRNIYTMTHRLALLAAPDTHEGAILEESYAAMMGRVIDGAKKRGV